MKLLKKKHKRALFFTPRDPVGPEVLLPSADFELIGPFIARFLRADRPLDGDLLVGQSTFYATI